MDLVTCLQTSALAGGREHLIVGAACAVTIASLGFGVQRGVVQRIMVGVLFAFVLLLLLGSVYVDCLGPALF
ncbi:hypothetical protein GCM10010840_01250 [Deinococcus aerolatus]|uniref:GDT1 family protein n=1 Tax=Deinococcus aerolatus TaxID=522487 RepID=A0ABQ2FZR9_9DEIO|nr:hypothetical protein [Deinococcus aerolatus]GGL67042.1 hypothetical protein GCM10010840_01250 [Deinococcus aerolatus]